MADPKPDAPPAPDPPPPPSADKTKASRRSSVPKLDERDHRRGCPATRTEATPAVRPASTDGDGITTPAQRVTVVRCIDCGGQTLTED